MSTIDPRAAVLLALQSRLAGVRPARPRAHPGGLRPHRSGAAVQAVAQRLAAIDRDDPDRRRKAVRVVLELEIARGFGLGLLNDPALAHMLDAVQAQMQADAQVARAVQALGDLLLAGG